MAIFIFFRLIICPAEKAGLSSVVKKQNATCVLAVAQPPAINLNRNADADFIDLLHFVTLLRLPLHARIPSALKEGFPVCGGCQWPQHRHPFSKKSFLPMLINSAFFASLGVFIVEPHTNAPEEKSGLFAHFFRRKPTGFCLKSKLYFLAFFQKNRAQNEVYQPGWFLNLKFWAFLVSCFDRIEIFFFHRKNQLKKIKFIYLWTRWDV